MEEPPRSEQVRIWRVEFDPKFMKDAPIRTSKFVWSLQYGYALKARLVTGEGQEGGRESNTYDGLW